MSLRVLSSALDQYSTCVLIVGENNGDAAFHRLEIYLNPYVCLNVDLGIVIVN